LTFVKALSSQTASYLHDLSRLCPWSDSWFSIFQPN
jgi:hypothetical protein